MSSQLSSWFQRSLAASTLGLALWSSPTIAQEMINAPPEGFRPLYNGKDLSGWHGSTTLDPRKYAEAKEDQKKKWNDEIAKHWAAKGDVLYNDGNGAYATTDADYGDFELVLQYKTVAKADSGIYLRGVPQVQIWDFTEQEKFKLGADKGSGGLWNNSAGAKGKDPWYWPTNPLANGINSAFVS